ncbi:COG4315 family predicted lipoprotein [Agromyces bauzanensis]
MRLRIASGLAVAALAVALAGCSSTATDAPAGDGYGAPIETEAPTEDSTTTGAVLRSADSGLGEIVVDGEGMTVYMFDSDTQGGDASTCEGQCATNWPAVTTDSDQPAVEGVTGEVGTITGVDGSTQVTLNGWPLYSFAGDAAAGDTNGQGVNDGWWVLTPAGEKIGG